MANAELSTSDDINENEAVPQEGLTSYGHVFFSHICY
jgi:hypothetical protein